MITVTELRSRLSHFSDGDLVSAIEDDESNLLAVHESLPVVPGSLPEAGEPRGAISTISGEVIVYGCDGKAIEVE